MNLAETSSRKTDSDGKASCVLLQCLIRFLAVTTYISSVGECCRREVISNDDSPYVMRLDSTTAVATEQYSHKLECSPREKESARCLNGGSCFAVMLHSDSRFVQCGCAIGWEGDRCEQRFVDPGLYEVGQAKSDAFQLAVVVAFAVASLLLLTILIFVVVLYLRRRKRRLELLRQPNTEEKHGKENVELTTYASKSHTDTESRRTITVYPISSV